MINMSIYDVEDIAKWKEDNMSCMVCREYMGLKQKCRKKIMVENGSESFNCSHYYYNGQLKSKGVKR